MSSARGRFSCHKALIWSLSKNPWVYAVLYLIFCPLGGKLNLGTHSQPSHWLAGCVALNKSPDLPRLLFSYWQMDSNSTYQFQGVPNRACGLLWMSLHFVLVYGGNDYWVSQRLRRKQCPYPHGLYPSCDWHKPMRDRLIKGFIFF